MADACFSEALKRVLAHEGGYINHPSDPGGPTNFGITLADYRRYIDASGGAADVKVMRLSDATAIYRSKYWDALRCDDLPAGLDYALFDYGVNSGVGRAAKVLRRLLGLADSGKVDDSVLRSVSAHAPDNLIHRLCDERMAFLKALKTWPVFGVGWSRRVVSVRVHALAMSKRAVGVPGAVPASSAPGGIPSKTAATISVTTAVIAATGAASAGLPAPVLVMIGFALVFGLAAAVWFWLRTRKKESVS